jgi:hypothetical protein
MGIGHDITISNCEVYDGHKDASKGYTNVDTGGILIGDSVSNVLVTQVYIHDIYDAALMGLEWEAGANQPSAITIERSHFVDNQQHLSVGGNVWLNGDSASILRNNIIEVRASSCGSHSSNAVAAAYSTGAGATGMKVYNNTIIMSCNKWGIYDDDKAYTDNENNIIFNSYSNLMLAEGTHSPASTYRNNLYYALNGIYFSSQDGSNTFTTVSTWSVASGDTGSVISNPLFVNEGASDFHLQTSSPAKGAGVNLVASVPNDYAGNPRSAPFDIGAYKFGASLPAAPSGLTPVVH